jgi:hypothetical protein
MHLWSASDCIYSPNRHSDAATRAAGRHRNEWGDIDNRLKTLFDALRVPGVPQEIASNTRPSSANEPHFTLLADDALIARINVETDRLLAAPDSSQVRLIIRVNIGASRVILSNPVLRS